MSTEWAENWLVVALRDGATTASEQKRLRRQARGFAALSGAGLFALLAGVSGLWLTLMPYQDAGLLFGAGVLIFLVGQLQWSLLRLRLQMLAWCGARKT